MISSLGIDPHECEAMFDDIPSIVAKNRFVTDVSKQLRRDLSIHEIGAVLVSICGDRRHRFVAADNDVRAADWRLTLGHRQITDAYLAGLAREHELRLITLDRALVETQPDVAVLLD